MTCAECGKEIAVGDDYFEVADNFLQAQYFDTREDAIFCSENCLLDALTVERKIRGEED